MVYALDKASGQEREELLRIYQQEVIDEEDIASSLVKIIENCWGDNRRGLEDKSSVCKEVKFEENLKIDEKYLNDFLDCELLPNSDCYPNDCSECLSPYFDDNDKIVWFAEPDNTELKINYFAGKRRIVVVGSPCDNSCTCRRDCKQTCIDNPAACDQNCFGVC